MIDYPLNLSEVIGETTVNIDLTEFAKCLEKNLDYALEQNKAIFKERDIKILKDYFINGKTKKEIAIEYGISVTAVGDALSRMLYKLRQPGVLKYIIYGKEVQGCIEDTIENKKYFIDSFNRINGEMSKEEIDRILKQSYAEKAYRLENLELSIKLTNKLYRAGINSIMDLQDKSIEDLMELGPFTKAEAEVIIEARNKIS